MTRRFLLPVGLFGAVFLVIVFLGTANVYPKPSNDTRQKLKVFVSILPQAYFVGRVGGERVDVSVMVGPGQSPATYEPRPKQMAKLSKASLFFRIGVPFENVWIERISKANPRMKVIDTRQGLELLPMKAHHHGKGIKDPHIWLSLRLVKIQAKNICDAFISEDLDHAAYYEANLRAFHHDLDKLDAEITGILKNLKNRQVMVFHPAWGYFCNDYALEQVPIELEGKEPSAKTLARLIAQAKAEGIRVVFVQKQFSKESAETVAKAIWGKVIQVDPLSREYLQNMRKIAETFVKVMQ
jgi:zinc transport system substrate-binding protein